MFVTTLVFGKLVTWMRGQAGTADLRALAYMDEVAGYVPPTAAPPAKKPILTILKQGRAFGLGLVLSTQNPVDLDYKAMSNAGTWLVGRLQTENDKARVLEGLRSAAGGADVSALDGAIGALQKRQFMLVSAKDPTPKVFATRWAMSYLRGPLTKEEVQQLTAAGLVLGGSGGRHGGVRPLRHPSPAARSQRRDGSRTCRPSRVRRPRISTRRRPGRLRSARLTESRACALSSPRALRCATTKRPRASTSSRSSRPSTARSTEGSTSMPKRSLISTTATSCQTRRPARRRAAVRPDRRGQVLHHGGKDVQARLVANRALEVYRNTKLKLTPDPARPRRRFSRGRTRPARRVRTRRRRS